MKISSPYYLLGLSLLAAAPCSAQSLINESFESYTAGQNPGSPWTVSAVVGSSYINVSTAAQSPFGSGGNTKGLIWNDQDGSGTSDATFGPNLSTTFTVPAGATSLLWSFDFMAPVDGIAANPVFYLADSTGKIGPRLFPNRTTTVFGASNGTGTQQIFTTTAEGTWYHVGVNISLADSTYVISLQPYGGSSISSSTLAFKDTGVGSLTQLVLADNDQNAANGTLYFDNISLTAIPEPSSAALLAAGGALACTLVRRRRPLV